MKVLLITHDTSLSGAPKSLLLTWEEIIKNNDFEVDVITLKSNNGLLKRFKNLAGNFYDISTYSKEINYSLKNRISKKITRSSFTSDFQNFLTEISSVNYDFIYANTIVTFKLAIQLKVLSPHLKIVGHVHELNTVLEEFLPNLTELDSYFHAYIVPSFMNQKCLENVYNIDSNKIHVIREAAQLEYSGNEIKLKDNAEFRVIMCGGAYWRKGDDLFVLLANLVCNLCPNIHFYWVGSMSSERKRVNTSDLLKMKLMNNVHFYEETEFPNDLLKHMNLFVLTSREDPFPLAAIEAGLSALPIVCFENATGISEYIEGQGLTIPYLDLNEMSNKIIKLYRDIDTCKSIGEINKLKFSSCLPKSIAKETVDKLIFL